MPDIYMPFISFCLVTQTAEKDHLKSKINKALVRTENCLWFTQEHLQVKISFNYHVRTPPLPRNNHNMHVLSLDQNTQNKKRFSGLSHQSQHRNFNLS